VSETLQGDLVETDGGAVRTIVAPLALVGTGEHRGAVAAVLEEGGIEFDAGEAAVGLDPARPPAAVILCPAGTLAAAGAEIAELHESTAAPLLVVCAEVRPGELRGALAAGATGVVLEATLAGTLAPTLAAIRAGQVCVPRREGRQIDPSSLSAREKQILGLVVMGYMNSEIADQLFVAISTVKSHLSSAFAKLGVRSRSEAVELIVDPERGLGMGILALGGEPLQAGEAPT
jgi:DNA-binding NarL/FixJ family response regulator